MSVILGLNVWSHDASACLVRNGKVLGALEQERLNGEKHTKEFPLAAVNLLLRHHCLTLADVSCVAVGWDFDRFIRSHYLTPAMTSRDEISYIVRDIDRIKGFTETEKLVRDQLTYAGEVKFYDHHLAHAAMAFAASPEAETASIVVDGFGDRETTTIFRSTMQGHTRLWGRDYPHSLGLVYSALTRFLGFKSNCDEGIVMGLAAYGDGKRINPRTKRSYLDTFRELIKSDAKNLFHVDRKIFPFGNSRVGLYSLDLLEIFGQPRQYEGELTQEHMDISHGLQTRLEEVMLDIARFAHRMVPVKTMTVSGGVALNCVANSYLLEHGPYNEVIVPCSPGDGGVAIGAAILASGKPIKIPQDDMIGLGPQYSEAEYAKAAASSKFKATRPDDVTKEAARLLQAGKILAWYQDGSEFGPRALGNRSIITAPFPGEMKDTLNARVKFREWFRPFAPIVLEENSNRYFETLCYTPYMMHAFKVRPEMASKIPAVVHHDGTGRVQTVSRRGRPKLAALLDAFEAFTGVQVLLNTSFNVKGQPIVETPQQAVETFESTNIDALVIGDYMIIKNT